MKNTILTKLFPSLVFLALTWNAFAQTPDNSSRKVNFGYSQNPKTKQEQKDKNKTADKEPVRTELVTNTPENQPTIAQKTLEIVKNSNRKAIPPTEDYKVGVGDVLFISLQNNPRASTYFTVLNDGTIDYPLAGEMVPVAGLSTDEIEELLTEKIKIYENPQVSVRVREYNSHKITVLGLVEKSGERVIQREALPLYVIRADAVVQPKANLVSIRRADGKVEKYDLQDSKHENVLVFPNDIVEFTTDGATSEKNKTARFIFIGGEVISGGKKDFHDGLTLTQAIYAAGGVKKEKFRKVIVRRKNAEGLLISTTYDLKSIKDGKTPDVLLEPGDVIEVGN